MFMDLKDLITNAINDLDFDDFGPDVELMVEDEGGKYDGQVCRERFERLINTAVDAVQKEME